MRRSNAYQKARKELEDVVEKVELLREEHSEILELFARLESERQDAEAELKEAAKVDALKDKDFTGAVAEGFFFDLTRTRTVDIQKLEKILGKSVTKVKGLADTPKPRVKINVLETLVAAGKLEEAARTAIVEGNISCSLRYGEPE